MIKYKKLSATTIKFLTQHNSNFIVHLYYDNKGILFYSILF